MIILGTNSIKDTGFDVANSLRFDDGSSDYLNRTQSTSPTNSKKGTISFWVKRGALGDQHILNGYTDTNNRAFLNFTSDDRLQVGQKNSGTTVYQIQETAQRRDVSAWYNCVFAFDTTDATASNRLKLYVNGSQVTDFTTNNEIEVNEDIKLFNLANLQLGRAGGGSNYFDGYLAEFVYVDGSQLGADSFGEFDSDSGIWKPIDVSGLTFGTNGFYLDFEDSSALGNDVSGNNNDFTVNNLTAVDQSTDTCTNNFATINSLDKNLSDVVLSEGNLKMTTTAVNKGSRATIGVSSGKWYWEIKIGSKGSNDILIGIAQPSNWSLDYVGSSSTSYSYASGAQKYNNTSASSYGASFTTNDIIGVALNMDDGEIAFYKNGSSQGTAYTGIPTTDFILPAFSGQSGGGVDTDFSVNFGSPPYSESGGNSDGNGYGNFAASVPSGYFCLNTKNLAEYG